MDEMKAVASLIDAMASAGVEYMVVGSLASSHFGLIRSTKDADFLIRATREQMARLKTLTAPLWRWEPQTAFDPVTGKTRHLLHLEGSAFTAELFEVEDDPFDLSRMQRRLMLNAGGQRRSVQSAEDVIVQKLRWSKALQRRKDWDDIQEVMLAQRESLDWDYIRSWCRRLGISDTFEQALAELPKPGSAP